MKSTLGILAIVILFFTSCKKEEREKIENYTQVDMSAASDLLGELTYGGFIIRSQADFDTLMTWSGDTMSYPGLTGTEVMLVFSQKVQAGNDPWVELYSITNKDDEVRYEFRYMTSERPDYLYGDWTTLAIIVDLGDQNADITFFDDYYGS